MLPANGLGPYPISTGSTLLKKPLQVPAAVKNGNYFEGLRLWAVNNEIRIDRPEKQVPVRQIFPLMTHTGVLSHLLQGVIYLCPDALGRINAAAGDVVENSSDFLGRLCREAEFPHARC